MADARGAVNLAPVRELGHANRSGASTWWVMEEESTPELRWPLSIRVYDAMRRTDGQIGSVLKAVTMPVLRTPWALEPGDARDEVLLPLAEDLGLPIVGRGAAPAPTRARDRFSWSEHLRLALLMLPFGHSYFEQVYRIDPTGLARLRKLAWRPPRTIAAVNVAADGGLESIEQDPPEGATENVVIPVDRLVAYVNEREGGAWLGQSLLRTAYKNWLLKDRALRVGMQTIERNGMGVPVYTAPEGASEADIQKGAALAQAYRSGDAAGAGLPHGATLELMGVTGELPDVMPYLRYQDEQIARSALGHFLNLGTMTGSWALGSTFADFFTMSLQAVALSVADVVNQHIVEDWVDINFGPDTPAPKVVFQEIGTRQQATAQSLKALTDAGIVLPDRALEESVRELLGLPPKDTPPPPAPAGPVARRGRRASVSDDTPSLF